MEWNLIPFHCTHRHNHSFTRSYYTRTTSIRNSLLSFSIRNWNPDIHFKYEQIVCNDNCRKNCAQFNRFMMNIEWQLNPTLFRLKMFRFKFTQHIQWGIMHKSLETSPRSCQIRTKCNFVPNESHIVRGLPLNFVGRKFFLIWCTCVFRCAVYIVQCYVVVFEQMWQMFISEIVPCINIYFLPLHPIYIYYVYMQWHGMCIHRQHENEK